MNTESFPESIQHTDAAHENEDTNRVHENDLTRRSVLRGAVALGAGVALPKIALAEQGEAGREGIEELIEQYEKTGEITKPERLFEYLRSTEASYYFSPENVSPEGLTSYSALVTKIIRGEYGKLKKKDPEAPSFEVLRTAIEHYFDSPDEEHPMLAELRKQFHITVSEERSTHAYNKNAPSLNDVFFANRLQCRSGSHFFTDVATDVLSKEDREKLVLIYTDGHMLPGYERSGGEFVGLEMTSSVKEQPIFKKGSSDQHGSFTVVRAYNATLENIAERKIHPKKTVLLEEKGIDTNDLPILPDEYFGMPTFVHGTGSGENRVVKEQYGFGEITVPEDDLMRPDIEIILYKKRYVERTLPGIEYFKSDEQYAQDGVPSVPQQ